MRVDIARLVVGSADLINGSSVTEANFSWKIHTPNIRSICYIFVMYVIHVISFAAWVEETKKQNKNPWRNPRRWGGRVHAEVYHEQSSGALTSICSCVGARIYSRIFLQMYGA